MTCTCRHVFPGGLLAHRYVKQEGVLYVPEGEHREEGAARSQTTGMDIIEV